MPFKRTFFLTGVFLLTLFPMLHASVLPDVLGQDPEWNLTGKQYVYDRATLFDYINGGAEVYLDLGFNTVEVKRYTASKQLGSEVRVSVYDMGTPLQALGLFREAAFEPGIRPGLGTETATGTGFVNFWQQKYFVVVEDLSKKSLDQALVEGLAKAISKKLPGPAALPPELGWLPVKDRVKNSERYVKVNFMDRDFLQNVLSSEYTVGNKKYSLFILLAQDTDAAVKTFTDLKEKTEGAKVLKVRPAGTDGFATDDLLVVLLGSRLIGVKGKGAKRAELVTQCAALIK